ARRDRPRGRPGLAARGHPRPPRRDGRGSVALAGHRYLPGGLSAATWFTAAPVGAFGAPDAVGAAHTGHADTGGLRAGATTRAGRGEGATALTRVSHGDGVVGAGPSADALGREARRDPDARGVVVRPAGRPVRRRGI